MRDRSSRGEAIMAERGGPRFRFGVFNPTHFIIAVIDDAAQAEAAAGALRESGFAPDDVRVITGEQVLDNERAHDDSKGMLARLASLFPAEEQEAVSAYVARAERGAFFLAVRAPEQDQRSTARGILAAHGGHMMRYYGENTVADL
jgi:hypothetical protein